MKTIDEERRPDAMEDAGQFDRTAVQACAVLAIGLAFAIAVAQQRFHLNGNFYFTYWTWTWRDLGIFKTAALTLAPFLLIAGVLWSEEKGRSRSLWLPLALLALANYLLQVLSMLADPRGLDLVRQIVSSGQATSYFVNATAIQNPLEWLAHFQEAQLELHAMTHPPGPILFYYGFFKLLGPHTGALIGGCAVGLLASVGAAVMYAFAGLWTPDRRIRLTACAFYALLPALAVFFPEFDQIYPIFSMLLILFWVKALDQSSRDAQLRYAAYAGALLFAITFFVYNLLTTGTFLVYFGLYWWWRAHWSRPAWMLLLRTSTVIAATGAGLYMALWLATGFQPIASFRHALANQAKLQWRPYYPFPLWDPYDFIMGTGIVALPILVLHLRRLRGQAAQRSTALTLIGLAVILTVDVSGLLRGETTRVWLFLQPLVVVPVAMELRRFSWNWRFSRFSGGSWRALRPRCPLSIHLAWTRD